MVRAVIRATATAAAVIARRIIGTPAPAGKLVKLAIVFEGVVRAVIRSAATTAAVIARRIIGTAPAAGHQANIGLLGNNRLI